MISQFTNSDFNGLEEPVKFCWDKDGNDEVEFNYLSSITITYATSTKCRLKYSSDGSSWTTSDAGINGDTAFNLSGNKYVRLFKYGNADIVKITSLTLNYVC